MLRLWSLLYASSLTISSVAAGAIASGLYRHTELRNSAVRFVFFFFFFNLWLWSLFRGIFYIDMFLMGEPTLVDEYQGVDSEYFDALGLHGVAQITNVTRPWLSFILVMGDTALMASSLWMFPITWELSRLARMSMDRGVAGERQVVRWYSKWVHVVVVLFFFTEAGFTIYNHGFNSRSVRILIGGNMIQAIALVYVIFILICLKWTGRKYERVNGTQVPSPLYKRLKGIMYVYGVFSFQYQIISLILLFSNFEVEMPTLLIGISTLLFNNSGTALSIVMGCSQECFFRSFGKYLPEEYTTAFYVSEPSIAYATAAAGYSPPMVNPVFVYTDIQASSRLWAVGNGDIMRRANELHDEILRSSLAKYRGYEITTCGDAFQLAFHTIKDAVEYCIDTQLLLLQANWPKQLHNLIPETNRERVKKKIIFNGLRVRMGIHDAQEIDGVLVKNIHPVTGKVTYTGLSEVVANDMGEIGAGGQICVTRRVARWLERNRSSLNFEFAVDHIGRHRIAQMNIVMDVYEVTPAGLEGRRPTFQRHWSTKLDSIHITESIHIAEKLHEDSQQDWSASSQDVVDSAYSVNS